MTRVIVLVLLLIAAIYFGSGGFIILENQKKYEKAITLEEHNVTSGGVTFYNKEVMEAAQQQELIIKIYPYILSIPSLLNLIIAAISFGIVGSIGKVVNDSIQSKTKLAEQSNLLLIPIQGGIIGLLLLGISYTIPFILTDNDVSLRPVTILFLSLFGGIFHLDFHKWLGEVLKKKVFKEPEPSE